MTQIMDPNRFLTKPDRFCFGTRLLGLVFSDKANGTFLDESIIYPSKRMNV